MKTHLQTIDNLGCFVNRHVADLYPKPQVTLINFALNNRTFYQIPLKTAPFLGKLSIAAITGAFAMVGHF